ncbi:MAG: PQQ-dependent sugar dehydrogenase, partial [Planctomycetaceae bacterium]
MTSPARYVALWIVVCLTSVTGLYADDVPFDLDQRVSWTTSRVKGSPDPPSPYRTRVAFAGLTFDEPLDMTSAPGTNRLFVVERYGRVFSIPLDRTTTQADLVLDMNEALKRTTPKTLAAYGFALHPQYPRTRFAYITCVTSADHPLGTRVSRFRVLPGEPPRCDPATEEILMRWPSGGHNGGCLQFGPDGYLYIATGDSSGIADMNLTGQDLSNLPGSILRIDVNRKSATRPYGIPADNPFVDTANARPEIYAYGLRQPWKISFDRATGDLWTGNVGQDLWEMVYRIQRGGNYGWSVMEASHPFRPERRRGPTPILPPVIEHDHANFRSITGGFVYHGQRLKKLRGAYIYGDYDTGRVWMLRYDRKAEKTTEASELLDSSLRLVGFAEDNTGELYLLDHISGRIHELIPNPDIDRKSDFPKRLSLTGLFKSTEELTPSAGLIPYDVIAPQWADGAGKQRFIALPGSSQIEFETLTYPQPAPGAPPGWKFPDGTVLVETISL